MQMDSLNTTPRANRFHIALFGVTNAGKSSLINALTGQEIALVSEVRGTTTDPVYKAMELLPLGPVVLIDTGGLDDQSELGELRKRKTIEVLNKTDVALLVFDATRGLTEFDKDIFRLIQEKNIPTLGVLNKIDLANQTGEQRKELTTELVSAIQKELGVKLIPVSTFSLQGISELKAAISRVLPEAERTTIVADLLHTGDVAVLVIPIDESAPQGRLILPQQQILRELLDYHLTAVVCRETNFSETLQNFYRQPALVITDSQVFERVAIQTPREILLTSFSILFARYKGDLRELVRGTEIVSKLQDGDKILIAEACTHHRQNDDIGTVKIPRWLTQKTGKKLLFDYCSGFTFPDNLKEYALIVHCAGCMLNRRAMLQRIGQVQAAGVPLVNYGVLIAYLHGILGRALEPFRCKENK